MIRFVSKKAKSVRDRSKKARSVDPKQVAKALGAEYVGPVKNKLDGIRRYMQGRGKTRST